MSALYKQDGVDITAGDVASKFAGEICQQSYNNSRFVQVTDLSRGNFRGPRGFAIRNVPAACILTAGADGVGTKVGITDTAGNHLLSAADVFAMTGMDITRWGGFPLIFASVLDVGALGEIGSPTFESCLDIYRGMGEVAKKHGYVILTGETAELGVFVGSENPDAKVKFNLAGFMIGIYHPDKMILGDTLRPGQKVIVFRDAFRSNGFSSVRKALAMRYGPEWWKNPDAQKDIALAATPSVQYDRMLNSLHGWFDSDLKPFVRFHLIAHLSGGAFKGKFGDLLEAQGLSATLDNLFEPPEIMKRCALWRGMTSEGCYDTWNGGQGALAVVDAEDEELTLGHARHFGIEAKCAGEITKRKDHSVLITSKFFDGSVFPL